MPTPFFYELPGSKHISSWWQGIRVNKLAWIQHCISVCSGLQLCRDQVRTWYPALWRNNIRRFLKTAPSISICKLCLSRIMEEGMCIKNARIITYQANGTPRFPPVFSPPSSPFLIEGVLGSKNLFSEIYPLLTENIPAHADIINVGLDTANV